MTIRDRKQQWRIEKKRGIFDCGLRMVDCGFQSEIRIPNSEINMIQILIIVLVN
jgi:hypothetical protein